MTTVETWRAIPGHPAYEVSDMGNIRAVGYARLKSTSMVGPRRNYVGVQLVNPNAMPARAYRQSLAREGVPAEEIETRMAERRRYPRMVNARVHRLVLEAFVGPCPDGMVGCHNDGDTLNNRLDNLRWDTPSNNSLDKRLHGTDHQARKTHCPRGHEYAADNVYDPTMRARRCKECARDRARNQGAPAKPRTHCRNGHEMSGDNIRVNGNARKCRTCENARRNRRYAERTKQS